MRELNLQEKAEVSGGLLGAAAGWAISSATLVYASYKLASTPSSPQGGRIVVTSTACVWVP